MLIVRLNRLLRKSVEQLSANLLRQNKLHLRAMRNEIWNINHRFYIQQLPPINIKSHLVTLGLGNDRNTSGGFRVKRLHSWKHHTPWGREFTTRYTRCLIWQLFLRLVGCGWEHHTPWGRQFTTKYILCTRCVIWQLFSRLVSCGWEHHTPWGREFTTRYILCTSTLTTICKAFDVEHHTPCWGREWDIKS